MNEMLLYRYVFFLRARDPQRSRKGNGLSTILSPPLYMGNTVAQRGYMACEGPWTVGMALPTCHIQVLSCLQHSLHHD